MGVGIGEEGIGIVTDDVAPGLGVAEPFDAFYEREFPAMVGLAYALSGSRSGAEDIAQEAFLAAHKAWGRISGYDRPGAWVRKVVANQAVSFIRRRTAEARALLRLGSWRQPQLPDLSAETEEFWRAVRTLPRRQAQVVALHYLEDLPVAEIATVLDIAQGTVKAHLHAARAALARALGLENEEEM